MKENSRRKKLELRKKEEKEGRKNREEKKQKAGASGERGEKKRSKRSARIRKEKKVKDNWGWGRRGAWYRSSLKEKEEEEEEEVKTEEEEEEVRRRRRRRRRRSKKKKKNEEEPLEEEEEKKKRYRRGARWQSCERKEKTGDARGFSLTCVGKKKGLIDQEKVRSEQTRKVHRVPLCWNDRLSGSNWSRSDSGLGDTKR